MALKYWFEFTTNNKKPDDTNDIVLHRCEIYNDDFVGAETQIYGNLSLTKSSTDDTLEPIRGGGLTINLEASEDLTFEDFYTENERVFSVKYIRDNVEIFYGWLSPEGLFQSYVEDKWIISLDCTDGLGFLKNLSYVENGTGLPFIGKQSILEVIVNCLKRTNLEQDIYTFVDVVYDGQTGGTNTLSETYINSNRYIKDDENTYMNCDEVLRSLYDLFGLCITQYQGDWLIYKPNNLKNLSSLPYYGYNSNGVSLNPTIKTIDLSLVLGSQIDKFYPHHVNGNQQLSIDSSIGAYRINYKYGLVKSFFENIYLESSGDPATVNEWTIEDYNYLEFPLNNLGLIVESQTFLVQSRIIYSKSVSLVQGNRFSYSGRIKSLGSETSVKNTTFLSKVLLTNGVDNYYLEPNGSWRNSSVYIGFLPQIDFEYIFNISCEDLPISGDVFIELYTPRPSNGGSFYTGKYHIYELTLKPSDVLGNVKGENHTFQFAENPSTKIQENKEVYNGDNPSDVYIGTIYKSDKVTPTDEWNRGNVRNIPLLRYSGEERMAMYSKPLRVFIGDVFGYVDYLSVIEINNITGIDFMPIEYKYDALSNITTVKLKEILNDAGGLSYSNLTYDLTYDYGNVVEPTIKG